MNFWSWSECTYIADTTESQKRQYLCAQSSSVEVVNIHSAFFITSIYHFYNVYKLFIFNLFDSNVACCLFDIQAQYQTKLCRLVAIFAHFASILRHNKIIISKNNHCQQNCDLLLFVKPTADNLAMKRAQTTQISHSKQAKLDVAIISRLFETHGIKMHI